jgi:CheY-like chemotaxis protein
MTQTFLLVEDDENDVFFMKRAFQEADIKNPLHVVSDGQEAIDYLTGTGIFAERKKFPLPCLILLDLKLPHILGLDVLKWLRAKREFQGVIVVVLTSSKEDADIEKAYELGANSYLVKPPDAQRLFEMVKRIKEYWMEQNQMPPRCIEFAGGGTINI